jgi:hypothetical protein
VGGGIVAVEYPRPRDAHVTAATALPPRREIYMEKTRDLFNPGSGELKIRNDPKKGFFVEALTQNAVGDYESIAKVRRPGAGGGCLCAFR